MDIYSIKMVATSFEIIDQTLLPHTEKYLLIDGFHQMIDAIKHLKLTAAPAIGIAVAAVAYLAGKKYQYQSYFEEQMRLALSMIEASKPTAANLFYATERGVL